MDAAPILGEIIGPDLLIVIAVLCLLFGSSQLPTLARSLGRASKEFRDGLAEGDRDGEDPKRAS
jgi:sec-independent protein translocase protein TatA